MPETTPDRLSDDLAGDLGARDLGTRDLGTHDFGWRNGPLLAVATGAALLMAGAGALWAHYGTAVFFEMIRTGFAACFG